ncbi:hypothetical protein OAT16_08095 [Prolixibacteraceae bacterium]|nr:hypothetical protein [Prolixibacteraceae bacterium]
MKKISILMVYVCMTSLWTSCNKGDQFLITNSQIGQVSLSSSHDQLIASFGKENLKDSRNEGTGMISTEVLFKDPNNNIHIIWKTPKKLKPIILRIDNANSKWTTKDGIHIGTTLEELEEINRGQFKIMGFEIDRQLAGTVTDLEEGALKNSRIGIQFKLTKDVGRNYMKLIGNKNISSQSDILKKASPVVKSIFIVPQQ